MPHPDRAVPPPCLPLCKNPVLAPSCTSLNLTLIPPIQSRVFSGDIAGEIAAVAKERGEISLLADVPVSPHSPMSHTTSLSLNVCQRVDLGLQQRWLELLGTPWKGQQQAGGAGEWSCVGEDFSAAER